MQAMRLCAELCLEQGKAGTRALALDRLHCNFMPAKGTDPERNSHGLQSLVRSLYYSGCHAAAERQR